MSCGDMGASVGISVLLTLVTALPSAPRQLFEAYMYMGGLIHAIGPYDCHACIGLRQYSGHS